MNQTTIIQTYDALTSTGGVTTEEGAAVTVLEPGCYEQMYVV